MRTANEGLAGDARWQLVERVAASEAFAHSPAMRSFLLYVCEHALRGQIADIKEQTIGHHVLGRRPDYNPAEDNIVRVRARELRHRLDEYFATAGKDEPTVISLPKGGYLPVFRQRRADSPVFDLMSRAVRWRWSLVFPWTLTVMLAVLCGWLLIRAQNRLGSERPRRDTPAFERLWSQLFRPDQETLVVVPDSNFVLLQDLTGVSVGLNDYLHERYLQRPEFKNPFMALIGGRRYTGLGELNVVMRILQTSARLGGHIRLRSARNLDVRDLKTGNVVLMGARRSNPWVELFEPQSSFLFRYDPARRVSFIENRSPKPGESATYESELSKAPVVSFATFTFLPNLAGTGRVLIIAGLTTVDTEAAGEFITVPDACERLLQKTGFERSDAVRPFEALIKLRPVAGGFAASEIIAVHRPDL